ncbi:MAG: response regulator transcription factor [Dehalococcoidia bacterium]
MDKISVLIADDHPVVRQGLHSFLQLQDDIDIVGEAADGLEAVEKVAELLPDVVLMDLVMPKVDGIAAIRRITALSPSTRVLVLTSFSDDDKVFSAIKAGALGYLMKDSSPADLAEAIRAVYRGEPSLDPAIAKKVMEHLSKGEEVIAEEDLTIREKEVLRLIARGNSNKEIAASLRISEKTVKNHVTNILHKLHLSDRTQAALYAVRRKMAGDDSE